MGAAEQSQLPLFRSGEEKRRLSHYLIHNDTLLARFYVFWCGWFQVQVVEIKITIITISFGIAGPATTAAPVISRQ